MPLKVGEVFAELKLDSKQFNSGMRSAESQSKGFAGRVSGMFGGIGKAAVIGMAAAGVAVTGFSAKGIKDFGGFQRQMNEVFTLLPGISQKAMGDMQKQVTNFSKEFGTLPNEVVPALYQAISAGVPQKNVFAFLETAQKAAVGGVTDLETAVDGISSVVNAYGSDVVDATKASDLMFTAVRLGKTNFEQLSASLFQVIPTTAALGVEFGDVTAALAAMTAQGVPTSVATTQLRQLFVELSKEGTATSQTFQEIAGVGFKQFIAAGGNTQDALQLLEQYAASTGVGINDLFGSVEAGSAALALTGENAETFTANIDAMAESAGATQAAYETMDRGLAPVWNRLKANAAVAFLEIGERLAPAVEKFGNMALSALPAVADGFAWVLDKADRLAGVVSGPLNTAFELARDAALTFRQAMSGDWINAGGIHLLHQLFGNLGMIVGFARNALDDFSNIGRVAQGTMLGYPESIRPIIRLIASLIDGFGIARDAVTTFIGALSGNWQDDAGIHPLHSAVGNFGLLIRETIIPAVLDFVAYLRDDLIPAATDFGSKVLTVIQEDVLPVLTQLGDYITGTVIPAVEDLAGDAWDSFKTDILPVIEDAVRLIRDDLYPAARDFAAVAWPKLEDTFGWLKDNKDVLITAGVAWAAFTATTQAFAAARGVREAWRAMVIGIRGTNLALMSPPGIAIILGLIAAAIYLVWQNWDTIQPKLQAGWDWMKGAAIQLKDWVVDAFTRINDKSEELRATVIGKFTDLWNGITDLVGRLRTWLSENWRLLVTGALAILFPPAAGLFLIITHFGAIRDKVGEIVDRIKQWLRDRFDAIKTNAIETWNGLKASVVDTATGLRDNVTGAITTARDDLKERWDDIKTKAVDTWDGIKTAIDTAKQDMIDVLKAPFEWLEQNVGGIMTGAGNSVIGVLNSILGKYSSFIGHVKSAINWVSGKLGMGDLVPGTAPTWQIPELAKGGRVVAPGLAVVGEEGRELVELGAGARVIPNSMAEQVLAGIDGPMRMGVGGPRDFARGLVSTVKDIGSDLIAFIRDPMSALTSAFDRVGASLDLPGVFASLGDEVFSRIKSGARDFIGGLFSRVEEEISKEAPIELGGWFSPTRGTQTQGFGHTPFSRGSGWYGPAGHTGIDVANRRGTPIWAANDGVVAQAIQSATGYGNHIILQHAENLRTLYGHLERIMVRVGQMVTGGSQIGTMNSTGASTGDHLHFELQRGRAAINPTGIVPFANGGYVTRPTLALLGETARARPEIVAPEHLLRQLLREEGGSATRVYNIYGLQPGDVQREIERAERRLATNWGIA